MNSNKAVQKLYKDTLNEVRIICPKCCHAKAISVTKFKKLFTPVKVRCVCDEIFYISVESREFYRKEVNLQGMFINSRSKNFDYIVVENLSLSGIGFKTNMTNHFQIDELIELKFALDNHKQTEICKKAIVKQVDDRRVGAEFCDMGAYSAELGFYLMPS